MAKLTVETEQITYNGVQYAPTTKSAEVGDIIRFDESTYDDMTKGGFYEVTEIDEDGDAVVIGDDGDDFNTYGDKFTVFKRVESDLVTYNGAQYRKEQRTAKAGDLIIVTKAETDYSRHFSVGEIGTVTGLRGWVDEDAHVRFPGGKQKYVGPSAAKSEYGVLVPVASAKPELLQVGEYAKVTQTGRSITGKVVKVTENDRDSSCGFVYRAEHLDGTPADVFGPKHLVRATEAEVGAAKAEAERKKAVEAEEAKKRAEEAKWSAIGRKVGEIKAGDIVRVTGSQFGHPVGTIGVVVKDEMFRSLRVLANGDIRSHHGQMELVAPVESVVSIDASMADTTGY